MSGRPSVADVPGREFIASSQDLLEVAPDAMVIVGTDGLIALVNQQAEQLFQYARGELLGQPVEMLIPDRFHHAHPGHRAGYFTDARRRPMSTGDILWGRRKDGTEFPAEVSLSPIRTDRGMLATAAIRDVTERRRSDEQRFRLAALVDASHDAIIGKTLEGVITSWNRGAELLFGYASSEIVGHSILLLIPPELQYEEAEILAALAKGEVQRFDTIRRRKDGRDVHVSVTSSPVRGARGELIGVCKVARDITDRKRAERALAEAKDRAEHANRELEAFSYSVAHDLRAPLRGMNGFAQVLVNRYQSKLDAEGQDWLQEILVNAKKMGELIDGLLSLARMTRSVLRLEEIDLSAIVRETAERLAATDTDRGASLAIQAGLTTTADPRLVRALVENLVGNAWKFTRAVPLPHIEFGATEKDGAPAFFVKDNGAGFDMAFSSKLFAPFQRLHTATEFPGTGIGLATAQRIVHRHGGRIWAEGVVGQGATFYFHFPSRTPGVEL